MSKCLAHIVEAAIIILALVIVPQVDAQSEYTMNLTIHSLDVLTQLNGSNQTPELIPVLNQTKPYGLVLLTWAEIPQMLRVM